MLKFAALALAPVLCLALVPTTASGAKSCAHGYHRDHAGYCQPNHHAVNRYCAPGYVRQTMPGGWRCVPPHH
jgi:hypothetical protein